MNVQSSTNLYVNMAGNESDVNIDEAGKCCSVCNISDHLKRCGKCLCTWYCSRDHQLQDWKNHKAECRRLQSNGAISEGPKSSDTVAVNGSERNTRSNSAPDGANSQTKITKDLSNQMNDENGKSIKSKQKKKKNRKKSKEKSNASDTLAEQSQSSSSTSSSSPVMPVNGEKLNNQVKQTKSDADSNLRKPSPEQDKKYDSRPFKRINFPVVEDRNNLTNHIAKQLTEHSRCVIDNLLPINRARAIKEEVEKLHDRGSFVDGPLSGGTKYSEKSIRSDKITWLSGQEADYPHICQYMKDLDIVVKRLNGLLMDSCQINGRTKAMVACYPGNGTGYAYHVDNPNKDGRVLTFLYYLNEGWDSEKLGGNLRIFPSDGGYVDIEPILNRLFVFWSDRRNPHEVQPAWASRFAITMWYFDKEEREAAKRKAELEKSIGAVNYDLAQVQLKTKATEKDSVEKDI